MDSALQGLLFGEGTAHQTQRVPGRRKAELVCPRGLMGKPQSRLGPPSQVSTAVLVAVTIIVIIVIKWQQCSGSCRGQLLAHRWGGIFFLKVGGGIHPQGQSWTSQGVWPPAVKGAGR